MTKGTIGIHSIFQSISGEAGPVVQQGAWTTFIRTQGCPLRCAYCDTKDAQSPKGGTATPIIEILLECSKTKRVIITGGEPFLWPEMPYVLEHIKRGEHVVQVETNASSDWFLAKVPEVGYTVDVKCPCSEMHVKMPPPANLALAITNQIANGGVVNLKFVFRDVLDVDFAIPYILATYRISPELKYLFSPVDEVLFQSVSGCKELVDAILKRTSRAEEGRIIISVQAHKILGIE